MSDSKTENNRKPGRQKGCVKTGGRKPGVCNKKTYWLRDNLASVNFDWAIEFRDSMKADNYERAKILIELLPYLNPRIEPKSIEGDGTDSDDLNLSINLANVFK